MNPVFFLGMLAVVAGLYLAWGFHHLPQERWQMLACLPVAPRAGGGWEGINLTYYGLLTANAYLAAVAMALILLGSVGIPLADMVTLVALLLLCCVPASHWMARLVEGKAHTFTVGGAMFVGTLAAPWLVMLINRLPWRDGAAPLPVLPCLGAMAVAYCFGEGLGRLACISFGCCYGKPLRDCHPLIRRIFSHHAFIFVGKTKKIAYASGLEGEKVVPVQAVTAVLYVAAGLFSAELFFSRCVAAAFLTATAVTQMWRVASEFLRADYRGNGRFSVYQWLSLAGLAYAVWIGWLFGNGDGPIPEFSAGLAVLWNPLVLLVLQAIWIILFIHTGRSSVTGSQLSFHVHTDRI